MKSKTIKSILYLILCVLSLIYYGICIAYAWAGVSWLWIWPLLSVFCLVRFATLRLEITGKLHPPKGISVLYYALVMLFLLSFLFVEGNVLAHMSTDAPQNLDTIIVLGAAVRNGTPTTPLLQRIDRAAEYLNENPDTICIASGGKGSTESFSEAETIRDYLIADGISGERIFIEDTSSDTIENLTNCKELYPELTAENVGLVSNGFHICRALLIADDLGYEQVSGVATPTLLPLGIHYTVREYFGICQYLVQHLFSVHLVKFAS